VLMGGACPILDGKAFDPLKMPGVIRDKHHAVMLADAGNHEVHIRHALAFLPEGRFVFRKLPGSVFAEG
jgi:hypothetical protein